MKKNITLIMLFILMTSCLASDESKNSERKNDKAWIDYTYKQARLSFLCMQLAYQSDQDEEFSRLMDVGLKYSIPSSQSLVKQGEEMKDDDGIFLGVLVKNLRQNKLDPLSFFTVALINDAKAQSEKISRTLAEDSKAVRVEKAAFVYQKLNCKELAPL
jgi:hypothetical protein